LDFWHLRDFRLPSPFARDGARTKNNLGLDVDLGLCKNVQPKLESGPAGAQIWPIIIRPCLRQPGATGAGCGGAGFSMVKCYLVTFFDSKMRAG